MDNMNYAVTVLGIVAITALGVFLRLRWSAHGEFRTGEGSRDTRK